MRISLTVVLLAVALFAQDAPAENETILTVTGAIANGEARFDRAALEALGVVEVRTSTEWTEGRPVFRGPRLSALLDAVGADGDTLRAVALNDYAVEIPAADATRFNVILAMAQDGEPLSVRRKGPIWIVYPRDDDTTLQTPLYNSRSIWQLKAIDVR